MNENKKECVIDTEEEQDISAYIEVAEKFIEDIISKATHEVAKHQQKTNKTVRLERQLTLHVSNIKTN